MSSMKWKSINGFFSGGGRSGGPGGPCGGIHLYCRRQLGLECSTSPPEHTIGVLNFHIYPHRRFQGRSSERDPKCHLDPLLLVHVKQACTVRWGKDWPSQQPETRQLVHLEELKPATTCSSGREELEPVTTSHFSPHGEYRTF
ncbi:hypothetical protein F511_02557 [Dorcoceras hygrometricum]|nr:hypothetical protein F511_02557 [Dorcoceras hygrometricum]